MLETYEPGMKHPWLLDIVEMVPLPLLNQPVGCVYRGSHLSPDLEESKIASEREAGKSHQESAMQRTHELEAMKSAMAIRIAKKEEYMFLIVFALQPYKNPQENFTMTRPRKYMLEYCYLKGDVLLGSFTPSYWLSSAGYLSMAGVLCKEFCSLHTGKKWYPWIYVSGWPLIWMDLQQCHSTPTTISYKWRLQ